MVFVRIRGTLSSEGRPSSKPTGEQLPTGPRPSETRGIGYQGGRGGILGFGPPTAAAPRRGLLGSRVNVLICAPRAAAPLFAACTAPAGSAARASITLRNPCDSSASRVGSTVPGRSAVVWKKRLERVRPIAGTPSA